MAIVFISPQKAQRRFFRIAFLVFLLVVLLISLLLLLPEIRNQLKVVPAVGVFNPPDINIDFNSLGSDKVKNLDVFSSIDVQYTYTATDANGQPVNGTISAPSEATAKTILESQGLTVASLQQGSIGRVDPFLPSTLNTRPTTPTIPTTPTTPKTP